MHTVAASPDAGAKVDAGALVVSGPREAVTRPDGVARGVWEAPAALFVVVTGAVLLLGLGFLVERVGVGRIRAFFRRSRR